MRAVAVGLICCGVVMTACARGAAAAPSAAIAAAPKVFAPIGWATTARDLEAAFPKALVEEQTYEGEGGITIQVVTANVHEWPRMGPTQVTMVGKAGDPASMLELATDDPRPECSAESPKRPKTCRNRFVPELVRVFESLRGALTAELGDPKVVPLRPTEEGRAPDKRERSVRWTRPGQQITLALGREEYGTWSVTVVATRVGAPM